MLAYLLDEYWLNQTSFNMYEWKKFQKQISFNVKINFIFFFPPQISSLFVELEGSFLRFNLKTLSFFLVYDSRFFCMSHETNLILAYKQDRFMRRCAVFLRIFLHLFLSLVQCQFFIIVFFRVKSCVFIKLGN